MSRKTSYSYNISSNGAAGDWYWDVTLRDEIVTRGLADTQMQDRVDAIRLRRSAAGESADLCRRSIAALWAAKS